MSPLAWIVALLLISLFARCFTASIVHVVDIDAPTGSCPSSFTFSSASTTGTDNVCARGSTHPAASQTYNVLSILNANNNPKGLRVYTRINGTIEVYQSGSMDAYDKTNGRDTTNADSSNYVDGMSITLGSAPRTHVYTLALGVSYDTAVIPINGRCPCHSTTQSLICGGDNPDSWLSTQPRTCDSGNLGNLAAGWRPRKVSASFDVTVTSTNNILEVRLMADQPEANEDIGVKILKISVHETEDHVAPVLQLVGPSHLSILYQSSFVDQGATCVDAVSGTLTPTVTGSIDTSIIGQQSLKYYCVDNHQNSMSLYRTVSVVDNELPTLTIFQSLQQCVVQGRPYVEYSATCTDNVLGTYPANITGTVDTLAVGVYVVTYTCVDSWANTALGQRTVIVVTNAMPSGLVIERFSLQTSRSLSLTTSGYQTTIPSGGYKASIINVHPQTNLWFEWNAAISLGIEGCRYITINKRAAQSWQAVHSYEGVKLPSSSTSGQTLAIAQGTDASLSANLESLTMYQIVIDPHVLHVSGSSSQGNQKQVIIFETGDYSEPGLIESQPADGALAWNLSHSLVFIFNETLATGATGEIRLRNVNDGSKQLTVPCNPNNPSNQSSMWGVSIALSGSQAVMNVTSWPEWQPCAEYQLDIDKGCFADASLNANPSIATSLRFVTSCVVSMTPAAGIDDVSMLSSINITFSEAVQAGFGKIRLQPVGESAVALDARTTYPRVQIKGNKLTIDMACQTKICAIMAPVSPDMVNRSTTYGLCTGHALQECRGKNFSVHLEHGAVERVNGSWPATSLLNGTNVLPAQFESPNGYHFVLRISDLTPPVIKWVDVAATSQTTIRATVRLDESGTVYCAAMGGHDNDPCSMVSLVQETSTARCNVTRPDCGNCELPSYGCNSTTSMWVDDGCQGIFEIDGRTLECLSIESDVSIYDSGNASVMELGYRHACAIQQLSGVVSCWGKMDNVDPTTQLPPTGTFSSLGVGYMHTCAIKAGTSEVQCWGRNFKGETAGPGTTGIAYNSVTSGRQFSCALRANDSTAVCWGDNGQGQSTPPSNVAFSAIDAGEYHVCGIRTATVVVPSAILCWGLNSNSQSTPPAGVHLARTDTGWPLYASTISSGSLHSCAISGNNITVLSCWGDNSDGQSTPPASLPQLSAVSAGRGHTCVVNKVTKQPICWGANTFSQAAPPASLQVISVSCGYDYTCYLKTDHTLQCYGENTYQQSTPPAGTFGRKDVFLTGNCNLDTQPSKQRIVDPNGVRDAGGSQFATFQPSLGYSETTIHLAGLTTQTKYDVYCYAEDDERLTPNGVTDQQWLATLHSVTTLDRTAPNISILGASSYVDSAVTVNLQLTEPGVAYCVAVRDNEQVPTWQEILTFGYQSAVGSNLQASITIQGLDPDTEYDTYCAAHDEAALNLDAQGKDNWVSHATILATKRDSHTRYDTTPPKLLYTVPSNGGNPVCQPDGIQAGCKAALSFVFDEDVQRGDGNVTVTCLSNLLNCVPATIYMSSSDFTWGTLQGTTSFLNERLVVTFDTPLQDNTQYGFSIGSGAVQDMSGNNFVLEQTCPSWYAADLQAALGTAICAPGYTMLTPS